MAEEKKTTKTPKKEETKKGYLRMLKLVNEWEPPTEEHNGVKAFMMDQISKSIDFDCNYNEPEPVMIDPGGWIKQSINKAKRDVEYYEKELEGSTVKVHLGVKADSDYILKKNADAVVLATGGEPIIPDIKGIHSDCVLTAVKVFENEQVLKGDRVLIAGAGRVVRNRVPRRTYLPRSVSSRSGWWNIPPGSGLAPRIAPRS